MADEPAGTGTPVPPAGVASPSDGGSPAGTGTEGASNPDGGQGDTPEGGELTWEALKDKGVTSPADVLAKLAEIDRWKGHARTWETRAQQNARERDEAKRQGMSDEEKQRAELAASIRAEVLGTVGVQLAEAAFTRAATGKVASIDDALDLLAPAGTDGTRPDLKRYLKDDGTVDQGSIEAAVERLAKLAPAGRGQTPPKVDRGGRTGGTPEQLTYQQVQKMSPEEIMKAQKEGRMTKLLQEGPGYTG